MTAPTSARDEPARSRLFWPLAIVGWAVMAYAVRGLFQHDDRTNPGAVVRLVVVGDLVHDLVLVPVVLAFGAFCLARLPTRVRRPATAGFIISAMTALYAYPFVRGFGRSPSTPSRLPNNYATGLATVLVAVWVVVVAGALVAPRLRRRA